MHLAQTVEHARENAANEALGNMSLVLLDKLLQRPAVLVLHDHVNGVVGTKEIQHADHVRVRQARQRPTFLEETLHAVAEGAEVFGRNHRLDVAAGAQGQAVRQIFLDRHLPALGVGRQIDDRKTAERKLAVDNVLFEGVAVR